MTYTQSSSLSGADRAAASVLAAFALFVVGYTATRMTLSAASSEAAVDANIDVLPHQAELWKDFAG